MASVNQVDQVRFQQMLAADPYVQKIIASVWGNTPVNQRPSDTPKHLEKANKQASHQISAYLKAQGVQLPPHTFINPRTASLEAEHGWAGLPTGAKIAIIGGAAAGGLGLAASLGAFGGAAAGGGAAGAAGGATVPSVGATGGLAAGALPTVAGTAGAGAGAGAAGTAAAGGSIMGAAGTGSRIMNWLDKGMDVANRVSPILGGMADKRAGARQAEAEDALRRDQLTAQMQRDRENSIINRAKLDLDQRQFSVDAPGKRLSTGVQGSMVSKAHNIRPESGPALTLSSGRTINPIHFAGMGADDLLTPDARQLGDETTHQMLLQAMAGDKFDKLPDAEFTPPTPAQGGSALDDIIGGASAGAGILGALGTLRKPKRQMSLQSDPEVRDDSYDWGGP